MYAVWFSPEEEALIESYRQLTGMTTSEIIRSSTIQRIEDELEYPGQIRVMLIRENRQVDYAK